MTVYYIDASIPLAVRTVIAGRRSDVLYAGGPGAPAEDTDDDVWLAEAGAAGWVVIHRDTKIRKRPRERQALLDSGARTFCMTHSGNSTAEQTLELLERRCADIETTAATDRLGPYVYSVTRAGIRKLFLRARSSASPD